MNDKTALSVEDPFAAAMAEEDVPATEATLPPKPIEHRAAATVSPVVEQAEVRKS